MDKIVVNARFLTQKLTGVQRFAFELSRRLKDELGDQIVFVAPKGVIQDEIASQLEVVTIGKMSGYFWEQIELPIWLMKHNSPKLLNLCSVAPLLYNNNYTAVHDITFVRYPETYSRLFCLVYNFLIPNLCKKSKAVITVSEFSKQEISTYYGIPEDKFVVVYNAAGDKFKPTDDEKMRSEKYFLAVSSVKTNKNFIAVLQAFENIQKEIPDAFLYVIGDCRDKNFRVLDLDRYMNNPRIKFLGRVDDEHLIKYYSNAVGLVFPSYYEGFGIPVIEAQSCGCPVISSNASSLPEVLHDSAIFFSPDNVSELSEKMLVLFHDKSLRERLVAKGFENSKRFSWDLSTDKLLDLINIQ